MPNRSAKAKKQERRTKNEYLKKNGRTKKQIARKLRRSKSKGVTSTVGNKKQLTW